MEKTDIGWNVLVFVSLRKLHLLTKFFFCVSQWTLNFLQNFCVRFLNICIQLKNFVDAKFLGGAQNFICLRTDTSFLVSLQKFCKWTQKHWNVFFHAVPYHNDIRGLISELHFWKGLLHWQGVCRLFISNESCNFQSCPRNQPIITQCCYVNRCLTHICTNSTTSPFIYKPTEKCPVI